MQNSTNNYANLLAKKVSYQIDEINHHDFDFNFKFEDQTEKHEFKNKQRINKLSGMHTSKIRDGDLNFSVSGKGLGYKNIKVIRPKPFDTLLRINEQQRDQTKTYNGRVNRKSNSKPGIFNGLDIKFSIKNLRPSDIRRRFINQGRLYYFNQDIHIRPIIFRQHGSDSLQQIYVGGQSVIKTFKQ
ncbi:hypothetical protein ROZALSC1DRAFT_28905 [Rozella allomycis CSF55]|uniref:Uncharacterized protein n=1 Tax=Rozella allomycis (strain CSF55) TaxID=988480 RepID=A0A075AYP5_ROZAC|nr:hypothetical protein O9G_003813 [Rozella allomycis CSF55]RKP19509.1 hypothetical protein ROZALSC1DRAFT_28905 [Rozella allomycis CSF55]|eukprot:EPZ35402.1 hypothetical protein O9G_003813 [Rozella allomycis CSF55]